MGMSASQARFLMLTARKNNVEFEGQQINQQRTTLSNESAAYYSELCNMVVPTPPSIDDFTKVSYTFDDGALKNTITTMIARNDGKYSINYIQQWQDDYSIVSASSSMIAFSASTNQYKVGSTPLRQLGQGSGQITQNTIVIDGTEYTIQYDPATNEPYVDLVKKTQGVEDLTDEEVTKLNYFQVSAEDLQTLGTMDFSKIQMEKNGNTATFTDGTNTVTLNSINKQDGVFVDPNTGDTIPNVDESSLLIVLYDDTAATLEDKVKFVSPKADGTGYEKETVVETTERHDLTEQEKAKISTFEDPYLSTLTAEQVAELLEQEEYYRVLLNEKCFNNPQSDQQWYVRYVKDAVKGNYVPYFYNMEEVQGASYPPDGGFAQGSTINCYSVGSTTKTKEVINEMAAVEKDSTGRYIALLLFRTDEEGNEVYTRYTLTTNTTQDEEAYNDAMNKYNYAQFQYDQKVQEINSKIEILQQQDKSLELELKHLDTEESAISTEMEAVKKVISKNIESSFKTFNA